jgi:hypothetical protein
MDTLTPKDVARLKSQLVHAEGRRVIDRLDYEQLNHILDTYSLLARGVALLGGWPREL